MTPMTPVIPVTQPTCFPPTREAALERLAAVRPADYARSRNSLDGAVTRLSPYITHGIVDLPEILATVAARHRLDIQHKFVYELGWREYFRHVWNDHGDAIFTSLHPGPLPTAAYAQELPDDVRTARTGIPAIDMAVRTLYETGYLHNHARMWLASYVVHLRKIDWRAGADWMVSHLLDGDLGSNHLSWQWVAGTGSSKPYLFNAENVARHAPREWHSPGSIIDTSYEQLDLLAHRPGPVPARPYGAGIEEPARWKTPQGVAPMAPVAAQVAGKDVWLVHPWALGDVPLDLPAGCVRLGWWPTDYHARHPWSAARWAFAGSRMAEITTHAWHGNVAALSEAVAAARSVETIAEPHIRTYLPPAVRQRPAPRLFAEVDRPCPSFSGWWKRATLGVKRVDDLPGMLDRRSAPG